MMTEDYVTDDERIYRRVRNNDEMFRMVEGKVRFSSSAFNDVGMKPSVDREKLRKSPHETKFHPSDGVVSLLTADVRGIVKIENTNALPGEPSVYGIDVHPRPIKVGNPEGLPENLAHAQIEANPGIKTSSRFKKLKEALAQLADRSGWLIEPSNG